MCISYLERTQQTLIHAHHCTSIVKLSTVIGRAEERDQLPLREEFIPVFNDLMSAANQVHIMLLEES